MIHTQPLKAEGLRDHTWTSPEGLTACIDYIAVPASMSGAMHGQGVLHDFQGCVCHDHKPVWIELAFRQDASLHARQEKLDYQYLSTPCGRQQLAQLFRDMPTVPWETDVDTHLQHIQKHLAQGLRRICPRLQAHARRPITSAETWDLIRSRRATRRELHVQSQANAKEQLRRFFSAWRGHSGASADGHFQRLYAAFLAIQIRGLSRQIVASAKRDAASTARTIFADACRAGPEALSRLFRSTIKMGRKYRKPHIAPALVKDGRAVEESEALIGALCSRGTCAAGRAHRHHQYAAGLGAGDLDGV